MLPFAIPARATIRDNDACAYGRSENSSSASSTMRSRFSGARFRKVCVGMDL
jgi:hypothetical protein